MRFDKWVKETQIGIERRRRVNRTNTIDLKAHFSFRQFPQSRQRARISGAPWRWLFVNFQVIELKVLELRTPIVHLVSGGHVFSACVHLEIVSNGVVRSLSRQIVFSGETKNRKSTCCKYFLHKSICYLGAGLG